MTRLHSEILRQLEELRNLTEQTADCDLTMAEVSSWSLGKQLEHTLKVDQRVTSVLEEFVEKPGTAAGRPTLSGSVMLSLNFIPRGRGQAPKIVEPDGLDRSQVAAGWLELEKRLKTLAASLADLATQSNTAPHPVFGQLDAYNWCRFMRLHRHHHLKIMANILAAAARKQQRQA